jgi:homoserine O-succinyltransferase
VHREDIPDGGGLSILADSPETGLCFLSDPDRRSLRKFKHPEHGTPMLADEYVRDAGAAVPASCFPDDDRSTPPRTARRSHAHLLFGNWIREIDRTTPFDPARIGEAGRLTPSRPPS